MKTNEVNIKEQEDTNTSVVFSNRGKDYSKEPLCLSGRGVTREFHTGRITTVAVDHVDFDFHKGELISIVGESGSGKTTLSKMLLGLLDMTDGQILFQGKPRDISSGAKKREYWKGIQAIFQDPFSSFNVFHKIDSVLLDCINMRGGHSLSKEEKIELMTEACSFVNLKFAELTNKYPFELSGGQMQRLMIARIFLLKPKILLADEPTSMVDACSHATILDMLLDLRDETTENVACSEMHPYGILLGLSLDSLNVGRGLLHLRGLFSPVDACGKERILLARCKVLFIAEIHIEQDHVMPFALKRLIYLGARNERNIALGTDTAV